MPLQSIAPHFFTIGNLQLRDDASEWEALARAVGVEPDRLRLIRQVHRVGIATVRSGDHTTWNIPEADVVLSDDSSAAIAVRVADCAPVLLGDRRLGVVAAAHAGWRGTVQSAAAEAVRAMQREFGSDPGDLVAAIGPCLGPCCGEVGSEVVEAFRNAGHDESSIGRWFSSGPRGRPHLDLWQANVDQLASVGVSRTNIHVAELCTKTHSGIMHSYRAAGDKAGRMVGVIRARS